MGFSEHGARHALVRSDNSLESAINLLTSMPAGWEPQTDAPVPAAAGEADAQDAEAEAQAGEINATVQQHDQGGASIQHQDASGEADTMSGAAVSMATNGDGAPDEPPMPQASATGSDVDSADEEQPLLGAHASGGASAIEMTAVDMPGENSGRRVPAEGALGDGDGDASEHAVADALQAEAAEHMPLDTPTMMELQEGMRGLMTALNATTAGIVNDAAAGGVGTGGGPMSGAMPILATGGGGDAASMLDPMRIVDEMRWGGAFPAMLGGLLAADVEEGGLAFDDYQSDSTVYEDDDDGSEVDDEEDNISDNEN